MRRDIYPDCKRHGDVIVGELDGRFFRIFRRTDKTRGFFEAPMNLRPSFEVIWNTKAHSKVYQWNVKPKAIMAKVEKTREMLGTLPCRP